MLNVGEDNGPSLRREISLFQAAMYGVGLILGAGIYVLIGDVAGMVGNAMWAAFMIASAIAVFTGLSYAELSSMFPRSAAEYVFVKNAFRSNLGAFMSGWIITFVAIASASAVAVGFSGYLAVFFPQFEPLLSAVLLVVVLSIINFIGVRESMWMNTAFTVIELVGLAIIVIAAVWFGSFSEINLYELPVSRGTSFLQSTGMILAAAGLAFFAYFGFENLANIAEETKNPSKNIPKALMISISATTGIYVLVSVSALALADWSELASTEAPLALVAEKAFGPSGAVVLSAIALFATSNTVLMMLVAASRIMFGMSKERALPITLGRIHPATKTPSVAVLLTMGLVLAMITLSGGSITILANVAVFAIFIIYALVNVSLIWLRYKMPDLRRPFRSPIRIGQFPLLAGIGFASSLAMLTQFDVMTMASAAIAVGLGFGGYYFVGAKRLFDTAA